MNKSEIAKQLFEDITSEMEEEGKKIAIENSPKILYYLERVAEIQIRSVTFSENPDLDLALIESWKISARARAANALDQSEEAWVKYVNKILNTTLKIASTFANSYVASKISQS